MKRLIDNRILLLCLIGGLAFSCKPPEVVNPFPAPGPVTPGDGTDPQAGTDGPAIILTSGSTVWFVHPDKCSADYREGVYRSIDVKQFASAIGLSAKYLDNVDECKPVDGGDNLLMTSSKGWCALVSLEKGEVLFSTTACPNAHSACVLPGGKIAVVCSSGTSSNNNCVQVYDRSRNNRVLCQESLENAHAVQYDEVSGKLYAAGGKQVNRYSLLNPDSDAPTLRLELIIDTDCTSIHDMQLIGDGRMLLSGNGVYALDLSSKVSTVLPRFKDNRKAAVKSINYDKDGGLWYTDTSEGQGDGVTIPEHRSLQVSHLSGLDATGADKVIGMRDGVYKVRIVKW